MLIDSQRARVAFEAVRALFSPLKSGRGQAGSRISVRDPRPERGLSSPQQFTNEHGFPISKAARLSDDAAGWKARAPAPGYCLLPQKMRSVPGATVRSFPPSAVFLILLLFSFASSAAIRQVEHVIVIGCDGFGSV